ncbi:DUF4432 family protein [Nonomuraea soli]|uniref:DUF4432 family protein n=1 Tax=Nonomuraea soli TaxID=1032476 RepID=A0A7W0CJ45_9ACTN|nr:DUF4432 family protein [Nonomuraea soli]MBA2892146.1 hypothetical protein [Nonomuraea soli]
MRNWAARIREVFLEGMRAFVLENERLRVTVLSDKGGDVIEFLHKPTDTDLVWLSPQGVHNPRGSDDFIEHYEGGWQEVFPNGGAPSVYRGARLAQHGEVAMLPWRASVVADSPEEVALRLTVRTRRLPFEVEKVFRLRSGESRLGMNSTVRNLSGQALEAMWGQHIVFGAPFLRPGCTIVLPEGVEVIPHTAPLNASGRRVESGGTWPVVGGVDLSVVPEAGTASDIVYLTGFDEGRYEVRGTVAMRVEWDARVLPYLWMWQEFGASLGHPWWGRAFVLGLEPFSSMPTNGLAEAVANGTAMILGPLESKTMWLRAEVLG